MIIDTLDALLEHAERNRTADCSCATCAPMHAIVELLETPFPCGWPKPELAIQDNGEPMVSMEGMFTASEYEVRGIAIALLRACDRAKAG